MSGKNVSSCWCFRTLLLNYFSFSDPRTQQCFDSRYKRNLPRLRHIYRLLLSEYKNQCPIPRTLYIHWLHGRSFCRLWRRFIFSPLVCNFGNLGNKFDWNRRKSKGYVTRDTLLIMYVVCCTRGVIKTSPSSVIRIKCLLFELREYPMFGTCPNVSVFSFESKRRTPNSGRDVCRRFITGERTD